MIRDNYYIDDKRQIRLDKVLLGYEIGQDDSINEEEIKVRLRRH